MKLKPEIPVSQKGKKIQMRGKKLGPFFGMGNGILANPKLKAL